MKFSQKAFLISLLSLLLVACSGPKEEDYKSDVPVTPPNTLEKPLSQNKTPEENQQAVEVLNLPEQINLNVPFYSQAPDGDWGMPWQEACEESSLALALAYAKNEPLRKEEFKKQILDMVEWQNKTFGDYEHTTVDQTAQMLEEFFGFKNYRVLENPTVEQLKGELAQSHVIVAPFAGQELENPFYSGEGPRYHMMVIRGYDSMNFITNDVGTRRGENFIYPYATLMSSLHDWHETDMDQGAKKVIVLD